jgi:hypothetical protein
MFAESAYARRRRWMAGHFSFNTREGQCPTCRGLGHIDLDVQYLPDIAVGCPTCHGTRFNDATLAVRVNGLTIADVLGLSVHEALERFADQPPVAAALRPVHEVGLGYLRLGEPTPSLSGGESQRLRIASRLRSSQRGTLYVFDEPSTGLHPLDVARQPGSKRAPPPRQPPIDSPLRAGAPGQQQDDQESQGRQQQAQRQAGPFAVALALRQPRPGGSRDQPHEQQQQRLAADRSLGDRNVCWIARHVPRYAFWTSGSLRRVAESLARTTRPVSST